jgi:hypothetical protein
VARRGGDETPPATVVAAAAAVSDTSTPEAPSPARASGEQPPDPSPLGEVVPSGVRENLVFYAVPVDEPDRLPDIHFGLMAGRRGGDGTLTALVLANETTGSDKAAGFHAVTGGLTIDSTPVPSFGYYAGPAAKITGTVAGRKVQAHQAVWSQDPNVVFFWFDPGTEPAGLTALDAAGHRLPAGHTGVGHG